MKREKVLTIRLSETTKEQFDQLARDLEISSSTLGQILINGFIKSTLKAEETLSSSDVAIDTIKTLLTEVSVKK